MKQIIDKTNAVLLVTALLASCAVAQKEVVSEPAAVSTPAGEMTNPTTALPPVAMGYEEKQLRTLAAPGIPGLGFYPRVTGSTSTIPIGELLLAHALGLPAELRRMLKPQFPFEDFLRPLSAVGELDLTFPLDSDPDALAEYSRLAARSRHLQTHESYVALARGAADLILVAREPTDDELKIARENNSEYDLRPVALDALVFVANAKNPVEKLTLEQIRGVYTGAIKNWDEVGGKEKTPIVAVMRERNSGSEELMKKLVMGERKSIPQQPRELMTMSGALDAVERDAGALAYSVYYYERVMYPRSTIKPLAINGVLPTGRSIASRTYPLVEPVYVVTRKNLKAADPAATLRDWLLSSAGQKLIAASGYAPVGG